jgi:hypothetical protein
VSRELWETATDCGSECAPHCRGRRGRMRWVGGRHRSQHQQTVHHGLGFRSHGVAAAASPPLNHRNKRAVPLANNNTRGRSLAQERASWAGSTDGGVGSGATGSDARDAAGGTLSARGLALCAGLAGPASAQRGPPLLLGAVVAPHARAAAAAAAGRWHGRLAQGGRPRAPAPQPNPLGPCAAAASLATRVPAQPAWFSLPPR